MAVSWNTAPPDPCLPISRPGPIRIDHHQPRAPFRARSHPVVHHLQLDADRIAAPNDDRFGGAQLAANIRFAGTAPPARAGVRDRPEYCADCPRDGHAATR